MYSIDKLSEEDILKEVFSSRIDAFSAKILPHYYTVPFSKLHYYIFDIFRKKIKTEAREAIAAPRGFGKSTIMTLSLPLWVICESAYRRKNLYNHVIILSDVFSQAGDFLADIKRELESNEYIEALYPDIFGKGSKWRDEYIITRNEIMIRALGSMGKVRGRRFKQHRVELVVADDLENRNAIISETYRKHIAEWFAKDVLKTGGPKQPVDIFVVGTILHPFSLLNKLLTSPEFSSFNGKKFKAVESFAKRQDLWSRWEEIYQNRFDKRREKNAYIFYRLNEDQMLDGIELMWPEGSTYYELMVEKAGEGTASFFSEKQNEPFDPDTLIFPESIFHFYDEEDIQNLYDKSEIYIYLDSTMNKNKKSDYYALIVLMRHLDSGYLFILHADIEKRPPSYQKEELKRYTLKYLDKVKYVGIESNGFQGLITEDFKDELRECGIYIPIIAVQNNLPKSARIVKLEPLIKDGTIKFNKKHINLYTQTHLFGVVNNDDGPDALAGAVELINRKRFKLLTWG